MAAPRPIVLVVFDGFQSLDLTGPLEVFSGADRWHTTREAGASAYSISTVAPDDAPVRSSSGLTIVPDGPIAELAGPIDTLMVVGGDGVHTQVDDRAFVGRIAALAGQSRRVASVCSGAFLLAEAGLLDGRRATTHWARGDELARRYPAVVVDPEPIYVTDGNVHTSAGVTAGMDLALAMVEDDLGSHAALVVARWLVLYLRRPGSQAQFSVQLATQWADRDELRALQTWITEHPDDDCSVEALARRAAMSPRHLARVFTEQVGTSPGRYVEAVRLEAARRRLEESNEPVDAVAGQCGFGSTETMRRVFLRHLGVPPGQYRARFRAAVA